MSRGCEQPDGGVAAIIVSHKPQWEALEGLVTRLVPQVSHLIIVDNGSGDLPWTELKADIEVVRLPSNLGIAAAQNAGIDRARVLKCNYVLFFDQDSTPESDLVARLRAGLERASEAGLVVAGIGPLPVDGRLTRAAVIPKGPTRSGLVEVDHLISSGCLVPLTSIDRVGAMREELFIDYVDIEWCLRARSAGLRCYMDPSVRMPHEFGAPTDVLGLKISMRTPLRHYYLVRNSLWLWRQRFVPLSWKMRHGWRLVLRVGVYALVAKPHSDHLRMMRRGIADGWSGRLGKVQCS